MDELEKAILGLDLCANGTGYSNGCDMCPYKEERGRCSEDLMRDALKYLRQMEQQNQSEINTVEEVPWDV